MTALTETVQTPPDWETINPKQLDEVLKYALDRFHPRLTLACSFGLEDVALVHALVSLRPDARIFALDTGRLPEETYACAEAIQQRYGVAVDWFFPNTESVETLEKEKGLFSFRKSVGNRKECCAIRKVEPLRRALSGVEAWITGQRREQSVTRFGVGIVETDPVHSGLWKFNPLAHWTLDEVWTYVRQHDIPYNALHDRGYPSIGCAPCTRAIEPGEDQRAGRWWWEHPEHKECGLHLRKERS